MDFAGVQPEVGRHYLFVAIDRISKIAFAQLYPRATKLIAADFLRRALENLPHTVHNVLTDNDMPFGNMPRQPQDGQHIFGRVCQEYGIEHCFTKPAHPWTNGQVQRLNRTIKEATVQHYHYQTTAEMNTTCKPFYWPTITPNG